MPTFDVFDSLPFSLTYLPDPLPTSQLFFFSLKIKIKAQWVSGGGHPLERGWLKTTLINIDSPSQGRREFSNGSSARAGSLITLPTLGWTTECLGLMQANTAAAMVLQCPEDTVSPSPSRPRTLKIFLLPRIDIPWALTQTGFGKDDPCMPEHCSDAYPLHFDQLGLSGLTVIHRTKKLL